MKQEQKELLLKDLCGRLPYGVKIALKNTHGTYHHENIAKKGDVTIDRLKGFNGRNFNIYHDNPLDWDWTDDEIDVEDVKPYLFPLSSMTDEQKKELKQYTCPNGTGYFDGYSLCCPVNHFGENIPFEFMSRIIIWLNKNHFDYNCLIPKGLALDATGLNIY